MHPLTPPPEALPRHPIRVVAQRTGLTPATLRAWERRYAVVEPHRSEGGQRLYSDRDVQRLLRLRLLSDAGRAISLVAGLRDEEAAALLEEDREQSRRAGPGGRGSAPLEAGAEEGSGRAPERMVEAAFRRVAALDGGGLEAALRRAAVTLGAHPFLEGVMAPLLHRVGTAWSRGESTPAQEHLCTAVAERVLDWIAEPASSDSESPCLVVATLPGERHGLGARLVAATAVLDGWRVTQLGVDLPPAEIAAAARTVGARAVAISMVNPDVAAKAGPALEELALGAPDGAAILVGGAAVAVVEPLSLPSRAQVIPRLDGLREALGRLSSERKTTDASPTQAQAGTDITP